MRKSRVTEGQIIRMLHEVETGTTVNDLCRHRGISHEAF